MSNNSFKSGQSTLEVIIAMAIFSLIGAAVISLAVGGYNAMTQGGEQTQAEALAQEGIEAVRSIRDRAWNELIYNQSAVEISGDQWIFSGEATTQDIGQFTRTITFDNVCRDELDEITACPGSYTDVQTKKVTVSVSWEIRQGITNTVQRIAFLTNWDSQEWTQTDWSGGDGQSIWSDATMFDSDDGNIDYSNVGEIRLAEASEGKWVMAGGEQFIDTTDNDFNQSEFNNTEVLGSGTGASIALEQINGSYVDSGTFLSRVFDSGQADTSWDEAYWTEVLPINSDLTIATRTGDTSAPDETWSSFSSELTDFQGSSISSPDGQYFQYRATLTRGDSAHMTPELADITIAYNLPTSQNLNDVSIVSVSDIWAAGNSGKILHYDGSSWLEFVDMGDIEIYSIDFVSSTDGWAVGEHGKIYEYNGAAWSEIFSPTSHNLNSIDMVDSDDGWAVGAAGTIIYYDEGGFLLDSSPTNSALNGLFIQDEEGDGWAAGENGKVLRANDGIWSEFTDTGDQVWNDIFMVSENNGWMVGDSGRIWHYNGTNWSEFMDTGSTNWLSVYFVSSNDGWVVGHNGDIYRWNGTNWTNFISPTNKKLKSVKMVDSENGWAIGDTGTIIQFLIEGLFVETGYLVSSAFDMGNNSSAQVVEWDETIPTCSPVCQIRSQIRTAPDTGGSPGDWTDWYGASGSGTYFTTAKGTSIPLDLSGKQWAQYRTELIGDGLNTPVLQEIRVNYK